MPVSNTIRNQARHADRPCQNPDALCQKREMRRFSSGTRYVLRDIGLNRE